jgi:glycosyltransferase involved in cell wall biosynthesis
MPSVLWWGRFDPNYSRNRILRKLLHELSWNIVDFHPRFSSLGDLEARLKRIGKPDLVWVPCFRQRDLAAASRWAKRRGVPLLFDPLISAYDKQIFERKKYAPKSWQARRLHRWEQSLFQRADILLADTQAHADYFSAAFGVPPDRVKVVYVGAETPLFHPAPMPDHSDGSPLEVLFYGSFIELQAPQIVVEAARVYNGPPVRWTLLGKGPLRAECERLARGLHNVHFEKHVPYEELPARIHKADILLGVFDVGAKAGRVIPNKVFQALACGRPVVTRKSTAYPPMVANGTDAGLNWVESGNPGDLATKVAQLVQRLPGESDLGRLASKLYLEAFSDAVISGQMQEALASAQALRGR